MKKTLRRQRLSDYGWPVLTGLLLALLLQQVLQQAPQQAPQQNSAQQQTRATITSPTAATSYASAAATALPTVVNIYTSRVIEPSHYRRLNDPVFRRFLDRKGARREQKVERSLGSGVIVRPDGYILTNHHVIAQADRIRVLLSDGRERLAHLVGSDAKSDLAVLKIPLDNLTAARFSDPKKLRIGDIVLAIGNPYGIGQTVTQGIVSAIGRHGLNLNAYENYIQTDAAINAGNSGGALINLQGDLVGINSGLYSKSGGSNGIGFAIPADTASHALEDIIEHGYIVRGWIGVTVEDIAPATAEMFGIKSVRGLALTGLIESGPAERAGLKVGDIITHINGLPIDTGNKSMHQITQTKPGKQINIRVIRSGAAQSLLVEVGRHPDNIST